MKLVFLKYDNSMDRIVINFLLLYLLHINLFEKLSMLKKFNMWPRQEVFCSKVQSIYPTWIYVQISSAV